MEIDYTIHTQSYHIHAVWPVQASPGVQSKVTLDRESRTRGLKGQHCYLQAKLIYPQISPIPADFVFFHLLVLTL